MLTSDSQFATLLLASASTSNQLNNPYLCIYIMQMHEMATINFF